MVRFCTTYESIDINNQVAIIISKLEYWFDFTASGTIFIGLLPRYPGFDPDYDPNGGSGGSGSGQGLVYGSDSSNEQSDEHTVILFSGLNANSTALDS